MSSKSAQSRGNITRGVIRWLVNLLQIELASQSWHQQVGQASSFLINVDVETTIVWAQSVQCCAKSQKRTSIPATFALVSNPSWLKST